MIKKHLGYKNKEHRDLFLLCWAAYFSTYICRLNYSAVMPELKSGGVFTDSRIALVSSAFFMCYGIGQAISGVLGDRINTRKMIFYGLFISSVSNMLIFFSNEFWQLLVLWAINGVVQSLVWSPVLKTASVYFNKDEKERFGTDISTTVPLGTLLSYAISLVTMIFLPWKYVFLTCGIAELIFSFIWILGTKSLYKNLVPVNYNTNEKNENVKPADFKLTVKMMSVSGVFLMLIPIIIQGTLKDSVTQWIPTFFSSVFNSGTTFSLGVTMILPIINVTGAYFARAVNKKVENESTTSAVFFILSALFLVILRVFGSKNAAVALVSMALITTCMFAVNVMLITMVPLRFHKSGRVSTIGGFLNAIAYIGCGGLNIVAGKILENSNSWNTLFIMWIVLAVTATVCSFVLTPIWKKYTVSQTNTAADDATAGG